MLLPDIVLLGMFPAIVKLLRPSQWLKNLILFAALIFAGELTDVTKSLNAVLAFIAFCLLSSGMYAFNDLIDREKDKQHPIKRNRPIASGVIPPSTAVFIFSALAIGGLAIAFSISLNLLWWALVFILFNLLYSIWLKNMVILDVMAIAVSFVIRAYSGAIAVNVPASKWLLINTLLLALFLGFGKRRHELLLLEENASSHRKILDKYSPYLLDQLIGVVTASVVVMYMLYTFSTEVMVKLNTHSLFLTIPFVVYGIFRYLYLIHKEEKGGSPTSVLISDLPILITVILWILTVILVLYKL